MNRYSVRSLSMALVLLLAPVVPAFAQTQIQHVIVIVQENRTPDNLFHGLPGADIATTGKNSKGQTITLEPIHLASHYGPNHLHSSWLKMYDGGKMDGADLISVTCNPNPRQVICPPPNPQFKYVYPTDVQPYFEMAEQYVFADRMFQTHQGPSFEAHQYLIAGTAEPTDPSNIVAIDNPLGAGISNPNWNTGCTAPPNEYLPASDFFGNEIYQVFPCFTHPTLISLLDTAGISWRYYTPSANSLWTGPNAISDIRNGPDWSNVILNQAQILTDITSGDLPTVSWVVPDILESDHPNGNDGSGPSWVASIVNTIGASAYWPNTAIFITWDDWGGWYDHVAPPLPFFHDSELGFRVPLVIVSPYAKQAYVSHVQHDFGSILKFVEGVFDLGLINGSEYADSRADDLSDCFNFTKKARAFHKIPAAYDTDFFMHKPQNTEAIDTD
jgi:phospholipase C